MGHRRAEKEKKKVDKYNKETNKESFYCKLAQTRTHINFLRLFFSQMSITFI